MKSLLIIALTFLCIFHVGGYPISPQPLHKQIENSQYIVIATIINPESEPERLKILDKETGDSIEIIKFSFNGDGIADLKINQVLKGKIKKETIKVNYPANISNPRPPHYPHSKKVIAFLNNDETNGGYRTVGLSYGTIIFEQHESTANFENLIHKYLPISKVRSKKKKRKLTASWLVECCKYKSTRWHGAYELNRSRHWMNYYDKSIDNDYSNYLTPEEKSALENIVLESDTISYNELCLSDFVTNKNHQKLKDILIFNLRLFRIFFSEDLMKRYIEIEKNSELQLIYDSYKDLNLTDKASEEKAIALTNQFIEIGEKK